MHLETFLGWLNAGHCISQSANIKKSLWLKGMSAEVTFDSLLADLSHPNPNIRNQACIDLAEKYPNAAMLHFLELLHNSDPSIYRTAVKGLGMLGHQTLPALQELFKTSENGTVKACCIKALVQVSVNFPDVPFPVEVMRILESALDDSNPVVAQSALMTLGHLSKQPFEQERVVPILIQACDRSNIAHVQGAAMALAELDSPLVQGCLQRLAEDESKDDLIREVAQASLARRESLNFS